MHKTKIVNPSKFFYFLISTFISVLNFLVSQGDRYLGMTAAMTQIPVPTARGGHPCHKGALVCPAPRVARKKPAPCGAGLGMVCFHLLSHIESDRV